MQAYPEQLEAARVAAAAGQGVVAMPTGCGKSITMALLISQLQVKTLIVVPNLNLKHQLEQSFRSLFGSLRNITILNIDSTKLERETDYDCLIIDEAHHAAAATYRKLNKKAWGKIYYRFFFTATPWRTKQEEQLLFESICGQVIYEVTYATAVEKGYIVPVEPYYFELPETPVDGYTWAAVYKEIVVENAYRNAAIRGMLKSLDAQGKSALCLVKEIAHGEKLVEGTGLKFAHGQNQDTKALIADFNSRKINVLVGTTGILGEGVDTKPAEYVLIAGLGKAKGQFMQQIGRAVRRYPGKESAKVIIFKDSSHKWSLAHYNAQVKVLREEYGVKPAKL